MGNHILHVFAPGADIWAVNVDSEKAEQHPEGYGRKIFHEKVAYYAMVEENEPSRRGPVPGEWTDSRGSRHATRYVEAHSIEGDVLDSGFVYLPIEGPCDKREAGFGAGHLYCAGHFEPMEAPVKP